MSYTVAVSQSKGGSCKTTVAINLAGALIAKGYKAIVGDMDKDKPDALRWSNKAEKIDYITPLFEEKPLIMVNKLKQSYDFVILDTPPSYMPAAFKAIMLADFVILPCSPSFLDQSNLTDAIALPRLAQKPFKILASEVIENKEASKRLINELSASRLSFNTYISHGSEILESMFNGQWIGDYLPGKIIHQQFNALADEIIQLSNHPCKN